MDELFNTSKTNWLELESDPAKTTNAALEELQKKNAEMFKMAIAEARRVEEKKSRQYTQLAQLIGQGVKTVKDVQKWKDAKDEAKDYEGEEGKEVNPEDTPKGPDKWGRDPDDPNWGIPPADVKKNKEKEKKDKTYMGQIEQWTTDQTAAKNTFINSFLNGDPNVTNKDINIVGNKTLSDEIVAKTRYAPTFAEENYARFMTRASGDEGAILLEGMPRNPNRADGRWTILGAEDAGENEIVNTLKRHYRAVFLKSPQLANTPKRIKRQKVYPIMKDIEKKARLASEARLTDRVLKEHKEERRIGLLHCMDGTTDKLSCAVGTVDNPKSGHVFTNEGLLDGTRSNTQGWQILLEDLEYLVEDGKLEWTDIASMREGLVPPRDGGREAYLNEFPNLKYWDDELANLEEQARTKQSKEIAAKRTSSISTANSISIAKLLEDKQDGVRIDNEYIDNSLTLIQKELQEDGIFVTKEELRTVDNSIDKYTTWEEVSDEDITKNIDKLIENKIAIPNADTMLVQIDDPELFKKYTKKLDEHKVRLSFVSKADAKKFNGDILPEINAYLQLTQTTTLKTPLKRNLIDNSLKLFKSKVAATQDKLGLEKAKELAFDEIQAEIANATEKGIDLPGKYTDRPRVKIDRDAQKLRLSTEKYIDNTPNALTDNKPWDYETPEIIQQRKDYLAGKAAPPIEDIVISNKFPNHTYHSVIETRVAIDPKDDKEGFEGNPADTEEQKAKINNADKLTNKPTPTRTFTALTSNDINQVLTIARKTDDVNSLLHSNLDSTLESPLERLGFDRPLSELSVDEIRGLVADESFHGFSDAQFGIFGIRGNQLKTILERESIDGDRLFDEDLQNELAIHNIRYKANQANSLSTISSENTRLTNISRGEQQEFLEIMGILSGDKDSKEIEKTAEWQFLNSPFNQLDVLLPAVQTEVMNIDPSTSTGIDWKGVGFPFVGIYQGMNERWKKSGEVIKERGKEVRQQRVEQEQKFPTK